eukprot:5544446-Pleurochrysis_carterae.AAC.2
MNVASTDQANRAVPFCSAATQFCTMRYSVAKGIPSERNRNVSCVRLKVSIGQSCQMKQSATASTHLCKCENQASPPPRERLGMDGGPPLGARESAKGVRAIVCAVASMHNFGLTSCCAQCTRTWKSARAHLNLHKLPLSDSNLHVRLKVGLLESEDILDFFFISSLPFS